MARNATNLLDRTNGYKASVDSSGNIAGPGLTGTYTTFGAVRLYGLSTAVTANTTATTSPAGSIAFTTHATGRGKLFVSDGAKWQLGVAEAAV